MFFLHLFIFFFEYFFVNLDGRQTSSMRITATLASMTDEDFERAYSRGRIYSDATLATHDWVLQAYQKFLFFYACHSYSIIEPIPLQAIHVEAFIKSVGERGLYTPATIKSTLVCGLKRIHEIATKNPVPEDVALACSRATAALSHCKTVKQSGEGKDPCIIPDLRTIIKSYPPGYKDLAAEAILWLLGVTTGARAVTLTNIKIGDIWSINDSVDFEGRKVVEIRYRVTKKNPAWNHPVSIEGYPGRYKVLDPVYWLDRYLDNTFQLKLLEMKYWPPEKKELLLFQGWSQDAMSARLRSRSMKAGFPKNLHSMHSLRAGFLCSAIILCGSNVANRNAVLENAAFIGGKKIYYFLL